MKKFVLYTLSALTILLVCQTASVEARGHHRKSTRVQVNVGGGSAYQGYVVRRYAAPVVYAPITPFATPVYVPVYPTYVEEVHAAPICNPFSFAGISLSWNLFR